MLAGGVRLSKLKQLRDVVIPEGTVAIGSYWFRYCNIESVVVPASVTVIGSDAFRGCAQLKRITF